MLIQRKIGSIANLILIAFLEKIEWKFILYFHNCNMSKVLCVVL